MERTRNAAAPSDTDLSAIVRPSPRGQTGSARADRGGHTGGARGEPVIVVGLTGSIAMGKSTVASMFAEFGAPVFDADAAVRDFYNGDGAKAVEDVFPGVLVEGRVDRERLSNFVLHDTEALNRLESLVHPVVAAARSRFVNQAASEGRRLIVVDVPLLLEAGGQAAVDIIVVVSAAESIQRARALARNGMSEEKLNLVLLRQMDDFEKRRRSHFVIDTSGSHDKTRAQVGQFMRCTAGLNGRKDHHARNRIGH